MGRHWEINGDLSDKDYGIVNYSDFEEVICQVKNRYDTVFGIKLMNQLDLYIDNATENSGWTPITTTVLGKYIIIKLNVKPSTLKNTIAFQFAHELTHFVFKIYHGIHKPKANDLEETICTAASLIIVKELYPEDFDEKNHYVKALRYIGYSNGAEFARLLGYDLYKLKQEIIHFDFSSDKKTMYLSPDDLTIKENAQERGFSR